MRAVIAHQNQAVLAERVSMSVLAGTVRLVGNKVRAEAFRTAVVPVVLTGVDYRRAHEACHKAALIWNELVLAQRAHWEARKADLSRAELYAATYALDPVLLELHSHTKQGVVEDLLDAVSTYRMNRKAGLRCRTPHRVKGYRPLSFTRNFGWRVTASGRLALSLGRGRARIVLALPVLTDPDTKLPVPASEWGEVRLCWDRDGRRWALHIAVPTVPAPVLDRSRIMGVDEGIINSMTLAVAASDGFAVTVINGRHARSLKHRRNTTVAHLARLQSKCTRGSRRWRKLDKARKKAQFAAANGLRNVDHQVSRKVANLAVAHDTGTIMLGDVRGIEKNTRRTERRRAGRHQRRRLSQWSRGRQERYLREKTSADVSHINEAYSSKTCPACLSRNRPSGRNYQCQTCGFTAHRDAVGAINILMRATHGEYRRIDPNAIIRVTYLRATPIVVAARSNAENPATPTLCSVGVTLGSAPVQPQALPSGTVDRKVNAA